MQSVCSGTWKGKLDSWVHTCLHALISPSIENVHRLEKSSLKRPLVVRFALQVNLKVISRSETWKLRHKRLRRELRQAHWWEEKKNIKQADFLSFHSLHTFASGCLNHISHWLLFKGNHIRGVVVLISFFTKLHCLWGSCNQGEKQLKLITVGEVPRVKVPTHPPTFQTSNRPLHVQDRKLGSATRGIKLIN